MPCHIQAITSSPSGRSLVCCRLRFLEARHLEVLRVL